MAAPEVLFFQDVFSVQELRAQNSGLSEISGLFGLSGLFGHSADFTVIIATEIIKTEICIFLY